ncbi:hypothetical protein EUGRSUZ_C03844 [Eucalyptus grandis]|uniref:Uncharacterized protein n=2 Tax=Eucalyptus grandis TaxID=71139 RepID=A0ACC3LJG7_EUCGR|nr:hypothetical protein EUGRSUZ_C03844 [Eucalyptus grandis]
MVDNAQLDIPSAFNFLLKTLIHIAGVIPSSLHDLHPKLLMIIIIHIIKNHDNFLYKIKPITSRAKGSHQEQ